MREARRGAIATTLALLLAGAAAAQTVTLSGHLGDNKAVLVIDGVPATVAVGSTVRGVTLKSLRAGEAEVVVGGRTLALGMGGVAAMAAPSPAAGAGRTITIPMGPGGHFVTQGLINGKPVSFMVDTGATMIAISASDARRMGLDWRNGTKGLTSTAAGVVPVWQINLTTVRVGDVEVYNVGAVVIEAELPATLLGNSFLGRFSMQRDSDTLRLEKR